MKLHPLTQLILTIIIGVLVLASGTMYGLLILFCWIVAIMFVPSRTEVRLTMTFLRLLVVAAGFLLVMHGIAWPSVRVSPEGVSMALDHFRHIAVPVAAVMYLAKVVCSEEIFALLVSLRVPPVLILIIFRTLWLVPQFMHRIDAVVTAQRLRGMRIEGVSARFKALMPTLGPVFSSMLEEIVDNSLVMTTRGFTQPGQKTHFTKLDFTSRDFIVLLAVITVSGLLWLF